MAMADHVYSCMTMSLVLQVPAKLYDEVLRQLVETDPETADRILQKLANEAG